MPRVRRDVDAVAEVAGCDTVDSSRYLAYGPRVAARCDGADYRRSYHAAQQRQGRRGLPRGAASETRVAYYRQDQGYGGDGEA